VVSNVLVMINDFYYFTIFQHQPILYWRAFQHTRRHLQCGITCTCVSLCLNKARIQLVMSHNRQLALAVIV